MMKDEIKSQQTRKMKRENPSIEICPGITRRRVANGKTMYQISLRWRPGVACRNQIERVCVRRILAQAVEI